MPRARTIRTAAIVVGTFLSLCGLIFYLGLTERITPQQAGLMAVALFGLYVGFGILIAVFRLINRLD